MKESATPPPTDFFSRILVKAQGAGSPIAPRLPSLFEPVAGVERVTNAESEEQVSPVAAREHPNAQPAAMASRIPVLRGPRPPAPPPLETTEERDQLEPGDYDRQGRPAEAAPAATLQADPGVTRLVVRPATRPDEQQSEGKPEFVMHTDGTGLGRTLESGREASWVGAPKKGHQESGALIPRPAAVPAPYPTPREAPGAGTGTARDLTSNPLMAEQPAPVINVTIGRVEVRAVQAPAATARIDPSKPRPLSLDDYLKRRGGNR